jgi:hypothetical protein
MLTMKTGIENLKDLIEVIVWIVGAASLAFAAYTYRLTKNQFNFAVITSCTERFQRIMAELKSSNGDQRLRAIKQYIDLCNEELFYFKNNYLPQEVIDEWIDGMVFYLPHFLEGENVNQSSDYLSEIIQSNLLEDYPRIRQAFIVTKKYDLANEDERAELVRTVKRNLK